MKQLRPISGVVNMAKITDRILAEYMLADMAEFRDRQQYGNEKGVSLNHLLLKMINKILTAVDRNTANEKYAVVLTMLDMDWPRLSKDSLTSMESRPLFTYVGH